MSEPKSAWGKSIKRNGYVLATVTLLPETAKRLDAVQQKRGLNKRTDALKEAVADYLQKHEKGGTNE